MHLLIYRRLLVFSAALILLAACNKSSQQTQSAIEEGTIENNTYFNPSLGWEMPLPKTYVVRPLFNAKAENGSKLIRQNRKLLYVCKTDRDCNHSLLVTVQDLDNTKEATPEAFYNYLTQKEENLTKPYKVTSHITKGTETIGGKTFYTFTIKRQNPQKDYQKLVQQLYFRFIGKEVLLVTLNAEEETERNLLQKVFRASTFSK